MNKILILKTPWGTFGEYMFNQMSRYSNLCDVENPYVDKFYDTQTIVRYFYKLILKICTNIPRISKFLLNEYIDKIEQYSTVIIFNDTPCKFELGKMIKKYNPKCDVKLWFYDSIGEKHKMQGYIEKFRRYMDIYTYDYSDSLKYNISFLEQFYLKKDMQDENVCSIDVMFCGSDKGRLQEILLYRNKLRQTRLISKFLIMTNDMREDPDYFREWLDYEDVLKYICSSKSILEINASYQSGLTMRAMESIFYEKKLITNNVDIMRYSFYNPNNIFVIGKMDWENIEKFVIGEYEKIDEEIVMNYSFEEWLKKICS